MLSFVPITVAEALRFGAHCAQQPFRACDYTVGAVFQWRAYFDTRIAYVGDMAILSADYPGEGFRYMFPVGSDDPAMLDAALGAIEQDAAERGVPLVYCAVPDAGVACLAARCGARMRAAAHRDWADYLYELSDLQRFPGRRFHGQRNHLNRFQKLYPLCRYVPVDADTLPAARAFLEAYAQTAALTSPIEQEEMLRAQELLEVSLPLGLRAGFLQDADGTVVALSIGEVVGDTLYVHVEKARLDYPGAYQAIVSAFCTNAAEPDTRYCNREDDSGEEGLRISKQSYHPICLIDKYWVTVQ